MPRYKTKEILISPDEAIRALWRQELILDDESFLEGATIRIGGNTGHVIVTLRTGVEGGSEADQ